MKYKLTQNGEARTSDYIGTVTSLDDSDLLRIKENTKLHNKSVRETSRRYNRPIGLLRRVRIMPRGPRVEAAVHFRGYRRSYDSYLPMGLGEWFDVYVGDDSTAMYELNRELETGMTPGELKKIDKLKNEIFVIELEGRMRKRTNNVQHR